MKREDYLNKWKNLAPITVTMTKKFGRCKHETGDTFIFKDPYDKPPELCTALWHVLEHYAWPVSLGFPSWEPDDHTVYRLHCPCETGTVWEMRKADAKGRTRGNLRRNRERR
jgi:uncharacterized repeat protein (TIGR04076 family)